VKCQQSPLFDIQGAASPVQQHGILCHNHRCLYSDVCPGLPTYKKLNITQFITTTLVVVAIVLVLVVLVLLLLLLVVVVVVIIIVEVALVFVFAGDT
jgi:hypothetical protein